MRKVSIANFNGTFLATEESNVYCTKVDLSDFIVTKINFKVELNNGSIVPTQTDLNVYFAFSQTDLTLTNNLSAIPVLLDSSKQTFVVNPPDGANGQILFYSNLYPILGKFLYIWFSHNPFNTTINSETSVFGWDDTWFTDVINPETGRLDSNILPAIIDSVIVPVNGTPSEIANYVGVAGELATDGESLHLLDGTTPGGKEIPANVATFSEMSLGVSNVLKTMTPARIKRAIEAKQIQTPSFAYDDNGDLRMIYGDIPSNWAYSGTTGSVSIGTSATAIGSEAFRFSGVTGPLILPPSLTSIGSGAFYGCSGLTGTLTLPNTITSIGSDAFAGCSGFTGNLLIPSSVTSIGHYAFNGCNGFTGLTFDTPSSITTIPDGAFYECSSFTGNLLIPNSVTNIGSYAFAGCNGFTGLTFDTPSSITSIGSYAFFVCSGFTGNLLIPSSVTNIGNSAFRFCSGFTGLLVIPNSVTSIGNYAFAGCTGLTSVNCYVTRSIMNASNCLQNTGITIIRVRASDNTWTAGPDTIGDKALTVIKDL